MNKSLRYLAAAGLISGGCWVASVWGQESTLPAAPAERIKRTVDAPANSVPAEEPVEGEPRRDQIIDDMRGSKRVVPDDMRSPKRVILDDMRGSKRVGSKFGMGLVRPDRGPASIEEMRAFQEAVEKLRSAKEGKEKDTAKNELLQLLEQSFARDLEHREQEVAEIESRVKKLREQIERRKKAKDEIVGLRLKTIVNETEGLGFSSPQDFEPQAIKRPMLADPAEDRFAPRERPDYQRSNDSTR
jgi:hypothetical protein